MQVAFLLEGKLSKPITVLAGDGPGGPTSSGLEMDAADAARWDCLLVLHCRYMYDDDDDAGARVDEADARNQVAQFSVGNHHPPARQTRMVCSFPSPGLLVCRGFCDAV